ncbi:MAG: hypothetical protein V1773_00835 [bacterium]
MKKYLYLLIFLSFTVNLLYAQKTNFIAGADINYYQPVGTLSDRFEKTIGGAVYFGKEVSKNWAWVGKLEYFKFDKGNKDKLHVIQDVSVGNTTETFDIPLTNLNVELEVVGLTANAIYKLIDLEPFKTQLNFGFGVYRWFSPRGSYTSYFDQNTKNFYTDTTGVNGSFTKVINVPGISQVDWSGGFNIGVVFSYEVINNTSIYAGCDYKNILGEIWQALSLNLESISSFQMLDFRAGIKVEF